MLIFTLQREKIALPPGGTSKAGNDSDDDDDSSSNDSSVESLPRPISYQTPFLTQACSKNSIFLKRKKKFWISFTVIIPFHRTIGFFLIMERKFKISSCMRIF